SRIFAGSRQPGMTGAPPARPGWRLNYRARKSALVTLWPPQCHAVAAGPGGRDGDEVVQVYLRDLVSSVAQPVRRLVAFALYVGSSLHAARELTLEVL